MAVAVPAPARGLATRAFRRPWRVAAIVVTLALVLVAAGAIGWTARGEPGVSAAGAAARYEGMVGPVNERCTGSMTAPTASARVLGPCGPALAMFAAAIRSGVWPADATDEATRLAAAADAHVGWLARLDAAPTADARSAVLREILAQQPQPFVATQRAAQAFRDALGVVGAPNPLV